MVFIIKKIKNVTIVLYVCAAIILCCMVVCAFFLAKTKDGLSKNDTNEEYILKEYNGKIAVFSGHDTKPIEVFEVEYSMLPYGDRKELSKGIRADSLKKIYQIAEDYDG